MQLPQLVGAEECVMILPRIAIFGSVERRDTAFEKVQKQLGEEGAADLKSVKVSDTGLNLGDSVNPESPAILFSYGALMGVFLIEGAEQCFGLARWPKLPESMS